MQEKNVGYLLVVDAAGKLIGIVTEHDLVMRVAGIATDLHGYTVNEVMHPRPTSLKASEPIKHALRFMALEDFM